MYIRMISKVVFFVASPFNKRDFKRYGVDILRNNGFEVFVYDFSPLVYPKLYEARVSNLFEYKKRFCFVNKPDAIKTIRELGNDTFVICRMFYNKKTFWIYKTLSKTKAPYAVSLTNAIPQNKKGDSEINCFLKKIPHLSYTKIKNIPYRAPFSRYLGIRSPDLVIAGGVKSVKNYRVICPFGKETEILWAHTLDYDIYLERRNDTIKKISNTGVFIDIGVPKFLGDDLALERSSSILTEERYYPNLCRFFDKVEKDLGGKIEIAAHPQSDHELYPDYFGKRVTVGNKSFEMINKAKFVMTHASTAVSFAVVLKKPIIFLTTDEYMTNPAGEDIVHMASWFGKTPINIDHPFKLEWNKELVVDDAFYSDYENSFIKKDNSEEINTWQIVANRLRKGF